MTKQVSSPNSVTNVLRVYRDRSRLPLLGLGMASFAVAPAQTAVGPHPRKRQQQEESVLVATREAPPSATKTGRQPKPTRLSRPLSPPTALPKWPAGSESEDAAAHFGDALAKIAQPPKHEKPAKPRSLHKSNLPNRRRNRLTDGNLGGSPAMHAAALRRAAAARADSVTFEAVKFQGIAVGKSTKHELITAWGEPADTSTTPEGDVLVYRKSPFQAVEVLVGKNGLVSTIKITLAAPIESKKLAEQLSLDQIDPVTISDDADKPIGLAFPERGVLFMFAELGEGHAGRRRQIGRSRADRPFRTSSFSRSTRTRSRCGPKSTCTAPTRRISTI